MLYDVIIIGAGILGGSVARQLSRYNLSILCLEKETDVCCGTSKANTGIIHSPSLMKPGSLKSKYCLLGNRMFDKLSEDLGFRIDRPGALVCGYSENDYKILNTYKKYGEQIYAAENLKPDPYVFLYREELKQWEPSLHPDVFCALFTPDAGRIIPYEYGIALWENSIENGVELLLNTQVTSVKREQNSGISKWKIQSGDKIFNGKYIVNAAGHGSNPLGVAAGFDESEIQKVKGEYLIFDRKRSPRLDHILFSVPSGKEKEKGKGILVTNTVYGNLMIGPDARWVENEIDLGTDIESLKEVYQGALKIVPGLNSDSLIKTFAGVRPKPAGGDFIMKAREGFIHLCGIESPGLTSSPAIGLEVVSLLKSQGLVLTEKSLFSPKRKAVVDRILNLDNEEINKRIAFPDSNPEKLICRCEQVPRSRILDAISRGIQVCTVDGVKRRTRAGQGTCQGAFCGRRVKVILAENLNLPEEQISQRGNETPVNRISNNDLKKILSKYKDQSSSDFHTQE